MKLSRCLGSWMGIREKPESRIWSTVWWSSTLSEGRVRQSAMGVMISWACLSLSDNTPLRMAIWRGQLMHFMTGGKLTSSSRSGSSPSRWNCKKLLSSAFLYLQLSATMLDRKREQLTCDPRPGPGHSRATWQSATRWEQR